MLSRFSGAVNALAFSPALHHPWLLTLGHDAAVLLWDTRDWQRQEAGQAPACGVRQIQAGKHHQAQCPRPKWTKRHVSAGTAWQAVASRQGPVSK